MVPARGEATVLGEARADWVQWGVLHRWVASGAVIDVRCEYSAESISDGGRQEWTPSFGVSPVRMWRRS